MSRWTLQFKNETGIFLQRVNGGYEMLVKSVDLEGSEMVCTCGENGREKINPNK